MTRFLAGILFFLSTSALVQAAPQAKAFVRYEGCTYLDEKWNDGDSFHVRMPDGKEQVLRLYFVDCPESENSFPERVAEQAKYFGITSEQSLKLGKEAAAFTKAVLSKPFVVQTRWRLALGRSKLPRFYAMIITAEGKDFNELLVSNGLARIYGTRTPLPDGRDSRTYRAALTVLENQAKLEKRGGWKQN